MPWFCYLEKRQTIHYLIHSPLDDYIPFVEYFIIPYLLWFVFLAVTGAYFFFTNRGDFYRLAAFLCSGMTIFLIVCTIFPNGLNLRPVTFPRENIFTDLVRMIYSMDTPTNVLPSIHVYNSIGAMAAIAHSTSLKKHRGVQIGSYVLGILIIFSTVFLKQHSITDVIAALAMACAAKPTACRALRERRYRRNRCIPFYRHLVRTASAPPGAACRSRQRAMKALRQTKTSG